MHQWHLLLIEDSDEDAVATMRGLRHAELNLVLGRSQPVRLLPNSLRPQSQPVVVNI